MGYISASTYTELRYCVNPGTLPANQDLNLWTDREAQEAFINHWEYFAERYKKVSYKDLSFNLLNEPKSMDENTYVTVIQKAIDKIQRINPDRIISLMALITAGRSYHH